LMQNWILASKATSKAGDALIIFFSQISLPIPRNPRPYRPSRRTRQYPVTLPGR
jgi:hypothetical protein